MNFFNFGGKPETPAEDQTVSETEAVQEEETSGAAAEELKEAIGSSKQELRRILGLEQDASWDEIADAARQYEGLNNGDPMADLYDDRQQAA